MSLLDKKITTYANPVSNLPDNPSQAGYSAATLKAVFDANANNEIKEAINGIIDVLLSVVDGSSGADNIGSTAIAGVDGLTVQTQLESIKSQLNNVSLGQIPDNSLTDAKLSSDIKIGSLTNLNTTIKESIVAAINDINTIIEGIDDLTTGGIRPLSAEQGKILNNKILDINTIATGQVTFTDSIPINGTITKTIPLGVIAKQGRAIVRNSSGFLALFNTEQNETVSIGPTSIDSKRYDNRVKAASASYTGSDSISVLDLYISGTDIVVTFKSSNLSSPVNLNCTIAWEVW